MGCVCTGQSWHPGAHGLAKSWRGQGAGTDQEGADPPHLLSMTPSQSPEPWPEQVITLPRSHTLIHSFIHSNISWTPAMC